MRTGNGGSGPDDVEGAAGPEPGDDFAKINTALYADKTHVSQADFDDDAPPSFERVHELVDWAVERVKKHLKWEGPAQPPWYPPPGHDNFRREYRHLLWDVQDPAHRAYIKKRFIRLWRYLQDRYHHKKRGGYPDKLRDAYFEQGEVRADLHHIGWGNASARPWAYPPLRIEVKEYLDKHRGTDRWCAFFTSDPHQVASLVPHVDDEDFPPDLLPIMKKYAVLAARDPAAIVDFWTATEHRNIHDRIWEPLLREAQAKVDALNAGALAPEEPTRRLVEEEPAIVEEETPSDVVKAAPDDDVSSDWKLRIGITNQLGAYVLRYPAAIARLRANGFRPEYFGCDHAFFADLFEIAQMPEDQWNRRLAEFKLKHSAEYSKYLRLGEHLPALSSDELAEYFIPLAGIIQPNPAPVEIDIEPINSHTILEQEPPAAPLQSSPIEIDELSPTALPEIVEQPPEPAVEEKAPTLRRDFVGHTVTPEDRLIGLIVRYRVPAADVNLKPEHFSDPDLRYTWERWQRLGGAGVATLDMDAIRARRNDWARFAIWLIDVAAAPDPGNPTDPKAEIATLAKQIRGRTEEPPPPLAATDVVAILPAVPPAVPLEIVEEIRPAPPAVEEASPPAPSCPTSSGNGHSDFVGFDVSEPPLPLDRAAPAEIEARNLQAALDLAGAGIPIFPARLDWKDGRWKKQPITKGWQVVRADQGRVRASWHQYPKAVPGIALGRAGLVVIDADRHGGPDGVATFAKLVAEHGGLPPGPVVRTAGGGFHYYFRQPAGKPLGNHEGALTGCGINVRGHTGWVVGPGGICPDGSEWRTADGSQSIIDAYRSGNIPTIPTWLVDLIRAPKSKKVPKERKVEPEAEATSDAAPPSSGKRVSSRSMDRRGKAWAQTVLNNGATELAAMSPHSGRNDQANSIAFQGGAMVARGWTDRNTVFNTVFTACETNNVAQEDGPDRIRDMIERAIAAGMLKPHPDLVDGRSRAGRQRSGEHDDNWRNMLRSEVMWLQRIRPGGEYATLRSADDVLAKIGCTDGREIGRILDFKFSDYLEIGRRRSRCPSVLRPVDKTDDEIRAHRAGIRNSPEKKAAKAEAEKARRLRIKQGAPVAPTNELEARRCADLVAYLEQHPGPQSLGQLVSGLKRSRAFGGLTDQSRRNAILRLVRGKLRELLVVTSGRAKNRKPTLLVELRR